MSILTEPRRKRKAQRAGVPSVEHSQAAERRPMTYEQRPLLAGKARYGTETPGYELALPRFLPGTYRPPPVSR